MHKTKPAKPEKRKSRLLRWLGAVLLVLAVPAVGVMLLFLYQPRAYQPQPGDESGAVSPYLTHKLGPDFINQVQLDKPFELLVEQAGLNDIIRQQDWIENFDGFSFREPVVLFDTGTIYLMGTLDYKGISSVVTVIALPQMLGDGRLELNITSIRLGVLPVTRLVGILAKRGFEQSRDCFAGEPELEAVVRAIIHNEPFEPVFKIEDRLVRVSGLGVSEQLLTLQFEPE